MKKIIALTAILATSSAFATENLEFGDLNYFIKQGQFNVAANAIFSSNQNTVDSTKTETEGYTFETDYGFGILDNLNAYVGVDYDLNMRVAQETTNDSKYTQDGLRNPSAGLNYRLINQKDAAVNLDFGVIGRFNVQDAERGTASGANTKDGNAADGRTNYEVNAAVGRKWNEANEWRLSGGVVHHMDGEYDQLSLSGSKTKVESDSSQDFYLRAAYQYRPVQEFMMALTFTGTQVGEVDGKANGKYTTDAHQSYDFLFNAKYLVTETFIVKFSLNKGLNPAYDRKVANGEQEIKRIRSSYYGLGVDFLF